MNGVVDQNIYSGNVVVNAFSLGVEEVTDSAPFSQVHFQITPVQGDIETEVREGKGGVGTRYSCQSYLVAEV